MFVCICHSVTDKAICKAVKQGHDTLEAVQRELKAGTCCGRCRNHVREVINESTDTSNCLFNLVNPEVSYA